MRSLLTVMSGMWLKKDPGKPSILALLAEERDRAVVSDFCFRAQWHVSFASTGPDALALIRRAKVHILLIDRDLAAADWRESISMFASSSTDTCIMLVSRVIDAYLWNEVVRNGGYEVLPKPLSEADVSRAAKLAWAYWNTAAAKR